MSPERIKVLLVEDNPGDARLLQVTLSEVSSAHFDLTCVGLLRKAIEHLSEQSFDAVLLDLSLPDSQGFDTFTKLHGRFPAIPIVVLSGLNDETLALRAVQEGAQDYLVKGQVNAADLISRSLRYAIERKRTQEALQESEERFRSAFDSAAIGMALVSLDGRWLQVNPALCEIIGYSEQELLATGCLEVTHPEDREKTWENMQQMLIGEIRAQQLEKRYFHKLGHIVWILLNISLVRNAQGEPLYFVNQIQDITTAKHQEEELKKSEEQLRLAMQAAQMGTWDWDIQADTLQQFKDLTWSIVPKGARYPDYETFLESIHPEDRAHVHKRVLEAIAGKAEYETEFRVIWPDGTLHWVEGKGQVLRNQAGDPLRMVGVAVDITDRKKAQEVLQKTNEQLEIRVTERTIALSNANQQLIKEIVDREHAEEALKLNEERLRLIVQTMPVMMNALDAEGNIIAWNRECEVVTGYSAEEIIYNPKALELLYPAETYPKQALTEWIQRGNNYRNWEWDIRCKDGTIKTLAWSNLSKQFPIPGWASWGTGIDITERKRAETEIRKALQQEKELNELKSHFVAMTSHEFRTPLSTILSSAELLEYYGQGWPEDRKKRHLHQIQSAIKHMTQLLDDVLVLGKTEGKKLELTAEPISLESFCLEILEEVKLNIDSRYKIKFVRKGNCVNTLFDERILRQILNNLLSNAIKYSPKGGTILFNLSCKDNQAVFHIKDEGIGIPLEDQRLLFEPFHRGGNVENIPGTGLGLTIVKNCVELYGGSLSYKSAPGKGTTFTVTLPINHPETAITHEQNSCHRR
ncbi:MAG: PAS domain S-box protein [Gloeobacterales cyanobacterium]